MIPDFGVEPYTDDSARIADKREHALIGLSPWNGYFSTRMVRALIEWAAQNFDTIDVVIPSYESAYTLIAAGTKPQHAVRQARRAVKKLRSPALRALREVDLGESHLHTTTTLTVRPRYVDLRRKASDGYRNDPALRGACRHLARTAVLHAGGDEPSTPQLDTAARYAIAELPLFTDSPGIFDVESSVVIYHQHIELADPLLAGDTTALTMAPEQGFVIASPTQAV
ncbi:MAG TPA: tRNA-dependent cyclodipeptide synthase [Pseudonocardiaceae bacterium]|jgi:cyclo(L-tyrosyl-L-tyrosyl) synthase|nr:tRNA-dependent cyclodipeptide synthase [Pseudonocardiaceae bacterium]